MSEIHLLGGTEFLGRIDAERPPLLLDVREPDEFASWAIPGAVNFPLGELADSISSLPPHEHGIVVVCAKGARAQSGAEILRSAGIDADVLDGGMSTWGTVYDSITRDIGGVSVTQFRRRGKGCLSYVIAAHAVAVVIDPSRDIEQYLDHAAAQGAVITHVFDTHLHADHLSGARRLAVAAHADLVLNPADPFAYEFTPVRDGMTVSFGGEIELAVSAVSAPGHTEGSTVFRIGEAALFTGDTLFLESVGRPDLADQAEAFARSLYRSLHERVLVLPDELLVLPAHVGQSVIIPPGEFVTATLGELRRSLAALSMSEENFVEWAIGRITPQPPNYQEIVRCNAGLVAYDHEAGATLEYGPNRCAIAS